MSQFAQQLVREFHAIRQDKAVLVTIVGGIIFYAMLYPQPYLSDRPVEQAVAVIDLDRSAKSRQLVRWADSTQDVTISHRVDDISAARKLLIERKIRGFMLIPYGFERDLRLGHVPQVSLAGDANYFLVYGTVVEGLVSAIMGIGAEHRVVQHLLDGMPSRQARANWTPLRLNARPLFNVSMGYLGYVVPAVFVLILQQTLLLAGGMLGAARNELGHVQGTHELWARFASLFGIYTVLALFYMGACFEFYGVVRNARQLDLFLMIGAFVAASSALAVLLGVLISRRELVAPIIMATSLPLVFTAGFVWPLEAIPESIRIASQLVPSTAAIQGFLKLNQMGANISQVSGHFMMLVALAIGYMGVAVMLGGRSRVGELPAESVSRRT